MIRKTQLLLDCQIGMKSRPVKWQLHYILEDSCNNEFWKFKFVKNVKEYYESKSNRTEIITHKISFMNSSLGFSISPSTETQYLFYEKQGITISRSITSYLMTNKCICQMSKRTCFMTFLYHQQQVLVHGFSCRRTP